MFYDTPRKRKRFMQRIEKHTGYLVGTGVHDVIRDLLFVALLDKRTLKTHKIITITSHMFDDLHTPRKCADYFIAEASIAPRRTT